MTQRQSNQRKRLEARNERVEKAFQAICRKEPKWRHEEHIKHCAEMFFLSNRTIEAILRGEYDSRFKETHKKQLNLFVNTATEI